ncbi:MAG: methyltransferase domain-containing protein [Thermodesulfobacteriota bacterium]
MTELFDDWTERYEAWFATPIGRLVKALETELVMGMLRPAAGELILDAGCGTGLFTADLLAAGARAVGLELSLPMLRRGRARLAGRGFSPVRGDMLALPFADAVFAKALSVTAIEFIPDAGRAVAELWRVTRPGGLVVAATLNRLSPWAERRQKAAQAGHALFQQAHFRSPDELAALAPWPPEAVATAIHFAKDAAPAEAQAMERAGRAQNLATGAFVAACWRKPA